MASSRDFITHLKDRWTVSAQGIYQLGPELLSLLFLYVFLSLETSHDRNLFLVFITYTLRSASHVVLCCSGREKDRERGRDKEIRWVQPPQISRRNREWVTRKGLPQIFSMSVIALRRRRSMLTTGALATDHEFQGRRRGRKSTDHGNILCVATTLA